MVVSCARATTLGTPVLRRDAGGWLRAGVRGVDGSCSGCPDAARGGALVFAGPFPGVEELFAGRIPNLRVRLGRKRSAGVLTSSVSSGLGTEPTVISRPRSVSTPTGRLGLAAGRFHTCASRAHHTLWCRGRNANGQLGVADTMRGLYPRWVRRLLHRCLPGARLASMAEPNKQLAPARPTGRPSIWLVELASGARACEWPVCSLCNVSTCR